MWQFTLTNAMVNVGQRCGNLPWLMLWLMWVKDVAIEDAYMFCSLALSTAGQRCGYWRCINVLQFGTKYSRSSGLVDIYRQQRLLYFINWKLWYGESVMGLNLKAMNSWSFVKLGMFSFGSDKHFATINVKNVLKHSEISV